MKEFTKKFNINPKNQVENTGTVQLIPYSYPLKYTINCVTHCRQVSWKLDD